MQLSETVINILLVIVILGLMVANFFVRKAKMERTPLGRVVTILDELRHNEKLIEGASHQGKIKKFRAKRWNSNRYKIDFVPSEIMKKLAKAFEACGEVNVQIERAKKSGADLHLAGVNPSSVKEPVSEAQLELREWLRNNMDNPAFVQKRRSLFGNLFGGGGGLFGGGR